MRVPPGVIAYEHNVEAMWPFPKFATQLIHVSEHRHSETSRAASFRGAALRPGGVELEYNYDCSVRLQLPAVRGYDGNAVNRYHLEATERREGEAVLPVIAPIRSPQAIFAFAAGGQHAQNRVALRLRVAAQRAIQVFRYSMRDSNGRCGLIYLKNEPLQLRYLSQRMGRPTMRSPEKGDLRELEVYKMLERLGIELGAGVIPRYGLMYVSAVRNCRSCDAAPACAAWLGAASSTSVAPDFCPSRDIFLELAHAQSARRSTAKH